MDALTELWEKGIDAGHGIRYQFFTGPDSDDRLGIFLMHRHEDDHLCIGSVNFDVPANEGKVVWQVHSIAPLHLEPSILQNECGLHGFIRDGKWISA